MGGTQETRCGQRALWFQGPGTRSIELTERHAFSLLQIEVIGDCEEDVPTFLAVGSTTNVYRQSSTTFSSALSTCHPTSGCSSWYGDSSTSRVRVAPDAFRMMSFPVDATNNRRFHITSPSSGGLWGIRRIVAIADTSNCGNNCYNNGICSRNGCVCNSGFSGSTCLPNSLPNQIVEHFDNDLSPMQWPVAEGITLLASPCGLQFGSGNSIFFNGADHRTLTSQLLLTNSEVLVFTMSVRGDCDNTGIRVSMGYSIDGGARFKRLGLLLTHGVVEIELPNEALGVPVMIQFSSVGTGSPRQDVDVWVSFDLLLMLI